MKATLLTCAALAAAALIVPASTAVAAKKPYAQCMTDDGYGRFRPCSAGYKAEHPNWRSGNECMTDDGYGRYRPCSALYKQKHQK
jgi:opacity protein-like surface antigen